MIQASGVPLQAEKYLRELGVPVAEWPAEIAAYQAIQDLVSTTGDAFEKRVYVEAWEFILSDGNMRFSYCLQNVFAAALADQRAAARQIKPYALYTAIERVLAGATFTSNFGNSSRWPLLVGGWGYSRSRKVPRNDTRLEETVLPQDFLNSSYKFGVHHFAVGKTIQKILGLLEERYGLDFAALERERAKKK